MTAGVRPGSTSPSAREAPADGVPASGTILVAHDGSSCARAAAGLAVQVARHCGLAIRGLFVVDESAVLNTYTDYWNELGEPPGVSPPAELIRRFGNAGAQASAWIEARCRGTGLAVTTEVLLGGVPQLIVQEASDCVMLALGRRGRRHPSEPRHIGRNFHAVARHTRLPVLVGGEEERPIRCQLLVYDGSRRSEAALGWARGLQRAFASALVVLLVKDDPAIEAGPARAGLADHHVLRSRGDPAAAIVQAAADAHADLVVMGGCRHTTVIEWMAGSVVDAVLRATPVPLLVT